MHIKIHLSWQHHKKHQCLRQHNIQKIYATTCIEGIFWSVEIKFSNLNKTQATLLFLVGRSQETVPQYISIFEGPHCIATAHVIRSF